MQSAIRILTIASVAILVSACAESTEVDIASSHGNPAPGTTPIEFRPMLAPTTLSPTTNSRSTQPITSENIADPMQLFGVYALYSGTELIADCSVPLTYTTNHLFYYFPNEEGAVDVDGRYIWKGATRTSNSFSHAPLYWPIDPDDRLTFFAYAPYQSANDQILSTVPVGSDLVMSYRPSAEINKQIDLCFATPVIDKTKADCTGHIPLVFNHALTRIELFVRYDGDLPDDFNVRINKAIFRNIYASSSVTINSDLSKGLCTWDTPENVPANITDYTLEKTANLTTLLTDLNLLCKDAPVDPAETNFAIKNNYQIVQPINGLLFLVPQSIDSAVSSLYVEYSVLKGTKTLATLNDEIPLPTAQWQSGHLYIYYLTLGVGNVSEVELKGIDAGINPGEVTYDIVDDSGNTSPELVIK